ncbi:dimer_Tnp_hAT domain-containing protein [Trichonephila clavipes]|nr:dimer_Tnp_hAT domain-containing protein [Trichonephila clavipes]
MPCEPTGRLGYPNFFLNGNARHTEDIHQKGWSVISLHLIRIEHVWNAHGKAIATLNSPPRTIQGLKIELLNKLLIGPCFSSSMILTYIIRCGAPASPALGVDTLQNDVLKYCKDLERVLTDGNSSSINALNLVDEIVAVLALLNKKECPIELLKFVSNLDFAPNLGIVLRILLTLPVSVASGEKSFSKLKLIKKFLRSKTTEDRLNGLRTIAIEHELAEEINVKKIIKKKSLELKVRKKHF